MIRANQKVRAVSHKCWLWLRRGIDLANVHRGSIALVDQLVASASNFLAGVIIGRGCSQQEFGLYMLGLSVVLLASRLQISLISAPYMVFSPRLTGLARAQYTGSTLVQQFGISAIAALTLVCGAAATSSAIGPPGLSRVLSALAFAIGFILLREYARRVYFAILKFESALLLDLWVAALQIGGLLLLSHLGVLTASVAFWTLGFACAGASAGWLFRMRKAISFNRENTVTALRKHWEFGKWILASTALWESHVNLYPWILTAYHGTAATGLWAACFGIASVGNPVVIGMQNLLFPKIAHSYAEGGVIALKRGVRRAILYFLLLIMPLSLILILVGGKIVALIYGSQYSGQELVVVLLALDLLVAPARFAFSRGLFAMQRADLDFLTNLVPLFVLLTLGFILVKAYGPVGVGGALLASSLAVTVTKYYAFVSALKHEIRSNFRDQSTT